MDNSESLQETCLGITEGTIITSKRQILMETITIITLEVALVTIGTIIIISLIHQGFLRDQTPSILSRIEGILSIRIRHGWTLVIQVLHLREMRKNVVQRDGILLGTLVIGLSSHLPIADLKHREIARCNIIRHKSALAIEQKNHNYFSNAYAGIRK